MAKISMDQVKELREKTLVGLMDCKKALEETDGNFEEAITLLRKKGAAVAAKRSENVTNEGIIASHLSDDMSSGSLLEVGCETDFSANTEAMQTFVRNAAEQANTEPTCDDNIEVFMGQISIYDGSLSMQEVLSDLIAKISENIKIAQIVRFSVSGNGLVQTYIHPGAHLGSMIMISADKELGEKKDAVAALARDICMQIAVTNPLSIAPDSLDKEMVTKEREHQKSELIAAGKPEQMIDKILEGKMKKYYEDICLLNQKFIKDDKTTVQKRIEQTEKETGISLKVDDFVRFKIGK